MISSVIAFIVGGLFVGMYYSLFIIFIFILKLLKKDMLALIIYLIYLISIGYFLNANSIYANWEILFFIVVPSIIVLDDILKDIKDYNKYDIAIAFLFLLSYLNKDLFIILILGKFLMSLYNKINLRGFLVYPIFVGMCLFLFINGYDLLKYSCLNQVIVLIAIGLLSFFGFVILKK